VQVVAQGQAAVAVEDAGKKTFKEARSEKIVSL
jgi:hypothetical protein